MIINRDNVNREPCRDPAAREGGAPRVLSFGRSFSDHMFKRYFETAGQKGAWGDGHIVPLEHFSLHPATASLHYSQQIFEGLKAYYGVDGKVRTFRIAENAARFNRSATRMCMPTMPDADFIDAVNAVVDVDRLSIPQGKGQSLYIRPAMISTDAFLGVQPSESYCFFVILSPVGGYYASGFAPVSIKVEENYVRAVQGGVGEAKTGGNYAAGLLSQVQAKKEGFTQVLWLDAKERTYVEEVGTMNIFFKIAGKVLTSPLTGTVLQGVTRMSVIQLLRDWGYDVEERRLAVSELVSASKCGELEEVFGTGTAAVISSVASLSYKGNLMQVADGQIGDLSKQLYDHITGIQFGEIEDNFG